MPTTPPAAASLVLSQGTSVSPAVRRIVHTAVEATSPGSYLTPRDGTDDSEAYVTLCRHYTGAGGVPCIFRPPPEIRAAFDGLER
ncbi:hypothetical protein [Nocardia sp. NBC_01329]|uniref:hypothetical protein n=1 Tax=Nocardia sp. NBC_01329 TaxID=2903594 RepID=UPI002E0E1446|nr:hypothetical protein OG405_11455 [Nocardia sp. NBC_01329]